MNHTEQKTEKSSHTLGTWKMRKSNRGDVVIPHSEDGLCIADCRTSASLRIEEAEANAKLISKAPELLQMVIDLKKCIERLTQDGNTQFDNDLEAAWIGEANELKRYTSMKKVYLLYSTDEHHSRNSYSLAGAFSEQHRAIRAAKEHSGYNLTENDINNLEVIGQTQGKEINYIIESVNLNEIL